MNLPLIILVVVVVIFIAFFLLQKRLDAMQTQTQQALRDTVKLIADQLPWLVTQQLKLASGVSKSSPFKNAGSRKVLNGLAGLVDTCFYSGTVFSDLE